MADATSDTAADGHVDADWHRRVVGRSLRTATRRSIDRGSALIRAATTVLARSNGEDITVQEVADEAGQSLRTLYQYFESKDDLLLAVFEETMRAYARLIEKAITDLSDPLERLAGALIAALRMPDFGGTGVDRGLTRLRLRLSEAQPELVGRSQAPVTGLFRELVEAAAAAGQITAADPEAATYVLLALKTAFITTGTLGNDSGLRRPDVVSLTAFGLQGLGAAPAGDWFDSVEGQLHFPARRRAAARPRRAAGGAPAPRAKKASRRSGRAS
jgi:AcrR family transcriptional regulator